MRPAAALLLVLALAASARAGDPNIGLPPKPSEDIVYPKDSGVINVRDLGAKGDGATDDTLVLQQALAAHPNQGAIIYLPNGTYVISDTLKWPHGTRGGWEEKRTVLQGQSRTGTVLKLRDGSPLFADAARPRAMVWTGQKPAQRFGNALRNLTFDTGKANPGAIGVQFMANNQGCVREVTIRSGDGGGPIGLDLGYSDEQGPCLIQNVTVSGFDVGISTRYAVDSLVFEHIVLENQAKVAFSNDGQCVTIRDLVTRGPATALENKGSGLVVLLDATLTGTGGALDLPAISNAAALFARNVKTAGFREAIRSTAGDKKSAAGPDVAEFVSHPILSLFPSPARSLGLPVKETPRVPWDKLTDWASPTQFGAVPDAKQDATAAIQAAIDSGKTTVYLPNGTYPIRNTILIRGAVRRIVGCEARIDVPDLGGKPAFKVVDGTAPVVVFEQISGGYAKTTFIEHASSRTLVIASCCNVNCWATGTGDLFLEDVCSNPFTDWRFKGQNVWARQLNVENEGTHVTNDGARLWILHMKTERGGTLIETRGGGMTELLGGFCYTTTPPKGAPMFINDNSSLSLTIGESCFGGQPYEVLVRETRGTETKELVKGEAPGRTGGGMLPLYVGYTLKTRLPR